MSELTDLRVRLAAIRLTGYSLCGIIFLIGLLNMVNSALTSMVLRRREFAMLETVGMTRTQLRRMLLYENSVGGVFGLVSFIVGSALTSVLLITLSVRCGWCNCRAFLSDVDQNIADRAGKTWRVK